MQRKEEHLAVAKKAFKRPAQLSHKAETPRGTQLTVRPHNHDRLHHNTCAYEHKKPAMQHQSHLNQPYTTLFKYTD